MKQALINKEGINCYFSFDFGNKYTRFFHALNIQIASFTGGSVRRSTAISLRRPTRLAGKSVCNSGF